MKFVLLILFSLSLVANASEKADEFKALEKNAIPKEVIAVLLKPYGNIDDFKIFNESVTSESCTNKTVIRASVTCNRKESVTDPIYFAEGNGLLCKISD